MKKHFFRTPKTLRYFTLGEANKQTQTVWILLHGYAQNADEFLQNFEALLNDTSYLIAPEGLSHFYWKDFTSNPVSSWMTRLDRTQDIEDINEYLTNLFEQVVLPNVPDNVTINCVGFSQGAPVLTRWLSTGTISFTNAVILAGDMAHDLNYKKGAKVFLEKGIHFVYGDEDKFVSQERVHEMRSFLSKENVNFSVYTFRGKHEVNTETIEILKEINRK